jgi:hypothetical protein
MGFIILPQALKHVIPGIVGNFISLLKDTSLVYIVGMKDLLEAVKTKNRRHRMGIANPGSHRLYLRRRRVLGVLFLNLPILPILGAPAQHRPQEVS